MCSQVAGREPSPEFAAMMAEQYVRLLDLLDNETLRRVAIGKVEGYTNEEIAEQLDCGLRTVERKLGVIRATWLAEHAALNVEVLQMDFGTLPLTLVRCVDRACDRFEADWRAGRRPKIEPTWRTPRGGAAGPVACAVGLRAGVATGSR